MPAVGRSEGVYDRLGRRLDEKLQIAWRKLRAARRSATRHDVEPSVMSCDIIQQLDQRFRVVCIDGDVAVDQRAAMAATDWTDDEFDAAL